MPTVVARTTPSRDRRGTPKPYESARGSAVTIAAARLLSAAEGSAPYGEGTDAATPGPPADAPPATAPLEAVGSVGNEASARATAAPAVAAAARSSARVSPPWAVSVTPSAGACAGTGPDG